MAGRLAGKTAIVTGAGSSGPGVGNGKAASVLFAREGASVLLVDRELERAQETQALIEAEGGAASSFAADVTSASDCAGMVAAAVERYGRLDVLHNNVGISTRADVLEVTEEQWDHIMAVNVKSIVLAAKYAIPEMVKGGGGSIITVSSIAGLRANSSTPYTTSKAAVVGLTKSMAGDHGPDGVRVNCIAPGLVYTPMVAPRMDDDLRLIRRNAAPPPHGGHGLGRRVGRGVPRQRRVAVDHGGRAPRRRGPARDDSRHLQPPRPTAARERRGAGLAASATR